jgi:hypothetical protein
MIFPIPRGGFLACQTSGFCAALKARYSHAWLLMRHELEVLGQITCSSILASGEHASFVSRVLLIHTAISKCTCYNTSLVSRRSIDRVFGHDTALCINVHDIRVLCRVSMSTSVGAKKYYMRGHEVRCPRSVSFRIVVTIQGPRNACHGAVLDPVIIAGPPNHRRGHRSTAQ